MHAAVKEENIAGSEVEDRGGDGGTIRGTIGNEVNRGSQVRRREMGKEHDGKNLTQRYGGAARQRVTKSEVTKIMTKKRCEGGRVRRIKIGEM